MKIFVSSILVLFIGCVSSPRFAGSNTSNKESPKTSTTANQKENTQAKKNKSNTEKVWLKIEGIVSYYAHDFHGKVTSNGEIYDMNDLTAAHRTFPFGTKVRVTHLENNKSVIVRINDRGPFVDGRIMDLSLGAAKAIDLIKHGTGKVLLEVLEWGDGE